MNSVNLYGRFGADPELRYTESGKAVANFRIAVDSGYGEKRVTEWVNCVAWGKTAEKVAEHGRKGKEIAIINGRYQTRSWEDKSTGAKRSATEVSVNTCVVGVVDKPTPAVRPQQVEADLDVDDIPF